MSSLTKKSSAIIVVPVVPVVPTVAATKPTTVAGSSAEIIDFARVKATKRRTARRRGKHSKNETLRRRRLGDLRKLIRDRCRGSVLPDDDAGREYLKELLLPISISPYEARNKSGGVVGIWGPTDRMRHEIEEWAPWLTEGDEAQELLDEIDLMPPWRRKPMARTLGKRLQVTYAERTRLDLRTIGPCDMTKAAMAVIRKQKKRLRERLRRLKQGAKPQAASISRTKPWIAAGFKTRRTWERNGKPDVATSCPINLTKIEHELATKEELGSKAGSCVRPSTATHAGQTGTCVSDGFLTADEAAWLVGAA